jgi:Crp-like helix-turn-helix domain
LAFAQVLRRLVAEGAGVEDLDLQANGPSCRFQPSRLARLLLLLANFGKEGRPEPIVGKFSQETLAEMIGTTRSRVSF